MSEELTRSSPHFKRYLLAALASPVNLKGADGLNAQPCRAMRFEGAGTITVKRSSDAASQTLTVYDGLVDNIICDEITSATLITAVTVYW